MILNQPNGAFNVRDRLAGQGDPRPGEPRAGQGRGRGPRRPPAQDDGVQGQRPARRLADQAALAGRGAGAGRRPRLPDRGGDPRRRQPSRGAALPAGAAVRLRGGRRPGRALRGGDRPLRQPGERPQAGRLRGLRGGQEAGAGEVRAGAEPAAHRLHADRHLGLDGLLARRHPAARRPASCRA